MCAQTPRTPRNIRSRPIASRVRRLPDCRLSLPSFLQIRYYTFIAFGLAWRQKKYESQKKMQLSPELLELLLFLPFDFTYHLHSHHSPYAIRNTSHRLRKYQWGTSGATQHITYLVRGLLLSSHRCRGAVNEHFALVGFLGGLVDQWATTRRYSHRLGSCGNTVP